MKKRTITLLLVLMLLLSSFSGGIAFAAETDPFTLATELTEDDQFVIVIEYEGQDYAMDFVDSAFVGGVVTIEDDVATPAADTEIWWAREDNQLENAGSTADHRFVYASSNGLFPYEDGRSFVYDDDTHHFSCTTTNTGSPSTERALRWPRTRPAP